MQFPAAVAADGHQGQIVREPSGMTHPGRPQCDIDQTGPVPHQVFDGVVRDEALLEQFRAPVEHLPKHHGRELAAFQGLGGCRQVAPIAGGFEQFVAGVQEAAAATAGMAALALALKVRTS